VTEEANATVKVFDWSPNGSMLAQVKRGAPASLTWKTTDRPRTVDEKNNAKFYSLLSYVRCYVKPQENLKKKNNTIRQLYLGCKTILHRLVPELVKTFSLNNITVRNSVSRE